jgi:hypothetical protein
LTDWPSVIVIALSLGSLLVSLASLVVAFKTKQVKTATRLESRINYQSHPRCAARPHQGWNRQSHNDGQHWQGVASVRSALVHQNGQEGNRPGTRDCISSAKRRMADHRSERGGNCCTEKRAADPHSAYEPRGDTAGLGAGCGVRQGGRGKKRPDRGGHHSSSAGRPPQVPRET